MWASGTRELDHREADGIDVTLLWDSATNQVSVAVVDERSGEAFELDVPGPDALSAFKHPYAYPRRYQREQALAA
jgi:hypothetical protein